MSTPAFFNLSLYQGDDFELTFRLREQLPGGGLGDYLDLTGYVAKAQIRATTDASTVLAEFTAEVLDQTATPGGVKLTLTHLQTQALTPTVGTVPYVWDVQLATDEATPKITTYLKGNVAVDAEVTR